MAGLIKPISCGNGDSKIENDLIFFSSSKLLIRFLLKIPNLSFYILMASGEFTSAS